MPIALWRGENAGARFRVPAAGAAGSKARHRREILAIFKRFRSDFLWVFDTRDPTHTRPASSRSPPYRLHLQDPCSCAAITHHASVATCCTPRATSSTPPHPFSMHLARRMHDRLAASPQAPAAASPLPPPYPPLSPAPPLRSPRHLARLVTSLASPPHRLTASQPPQPLD